METVVLADSSIPERYEPDWNTLRTTKSETIFMECAFYLLREAAHWTAIVAGLQSDTPLDRNRAIMRGLLVRISKLMRLELRELKDGEAFQQMAISRNLIETFATLVYLLEDNGDGRRYDQYVMHSLIAEREVLKDITENIRQRDEEIWDIEERMRRSIDTTAKAAGIDDVSTLPARGKTGFPSIEVRLKRLGPAAYTSYRMGSSETHGDWNDLWRNHLIYDGSEFAPNMEKLHVRPQPVLLAILLPAQFIAEFIELIVDHADTQAFLASKYTDLKNRALKVDALHENLLQQP